MQAAALETSEVMQEPRFSLLDGQYHGNDQLDAEQAAGDEGQQGVLALRGMAALALRRGDFPS